MTLSNTITAKSFTRLKPVMLIFCSYRKWVEFFVIFFIIFSSVKNNNAQGFMYIPEEEDVPIEIFPVIIKLEGLGSFTSDALYVMPEGQVYLSVEELFGFFKIPLTKSADGTVLSGFLETENRPYSVNVRNKQVAVNNRIYPTGDGLMNFMGVVFMESSLFGSYFGIHLNFDFRSLSIDVRSSFELPVVKLMRLERIRSNLSKMKGEIVADTVIGRKPHLGRFGNFDWLLQSTQIVGGTTNNRLGLGLGGELLYGEANASLNYYSNLPVEGRNFHYLWRWVDNNKFLVKQVHLGKVNYGSIASIFAPVIGYNLTNTPTGIRKAEGNYTITDITEPNWIVELYINNNLIDYTIADASGLFAFQVPLVYGFTTLEMRFYGPMGEERTVQRTINMPYTFTPVGKFEYNVSGGIVEDATQAQFSHNEVSYGLSRKITLGGGFEYLSSIPDNNYIPFVSASFLPFNKLLFKGEYAHDVKASGLLNYYFANNAFLEVDHIRYKEGQKAIRYNELSDTRIVFTAPYRRNRIAGFTRLGYRTKTFLNFNYSVLDVAISAHYRQFSVSLFTGANWIANLKPYAFSSLSMSYRSRKGLTLRSNMHYNYHTKSISMVRAEVEYRFTKSAFVSVAYEHNANASYNGIDVSVRYNLPFARTYSTNRFSNQSIITSQGALGSLSFGSGNNYVYAGEHASLGRAGITVFAFLDINHNGIYDKGEPIIEHLPVKINGGRLVYSKRDSIARIVGLEPFIKYLLEIDDSKLPDISWRIEHKKIEVTTDPNQFKIIKIPVKPMGEVSGYVKDKQTQRGIARMVVSIKDALDNEVTRVLTESDGYFIYMDLPPGKYSLSIDEKQLENLNFELESNKYYFEIKPLAHGDIVYDLDFEITQVEETELKEQKQALETDGVEVEILKEKEEQEAMPEKEVQIKKNVINEYLENLNNILDKLEEHYRKLDEILDNIEINE